MRYSNAHEAIRELKLEPLAGEGGYFTTAHRDEFGNAIYFLMTSESYSAWHKLSERETWVFLDGSPVELFTRTSSGELNKTILHQTTGQFERSIEPETWMAARSLGEYSLVLCFLAPPFSQMTLLPREEFTSWKANDPTIPELLND